MSTSLISYSSSLIYNTYTYADPIIIQIHSLKFYTKAMLLLQIWASFYSYMVSSITHLLPLSWKSALEQEEYV